MSREIDLLTRYFSRRIAEIEGIMSEEVNPKYLRGIRREEIAQIYEETRILEEAQGRGLATI